MKFVALSIIVILFDSVIPFSFSEHKDTHKKWNFDINEYFKYYFENRPIVTLKTFCKAGGYMPDLGIRGVVVLNHTITNGTLGQVCSKSITALNFEIETFGDGELVLDVPHDVFYVRNGNFDTVFKVTVYSTKYTEWEDHHLLERIYFPVDHVKNGISQEKMKENIQYYTDKYKALGTEHLIITKEYFDSFDRYTIPFLDGDYFYHVHVGTNQGLTDKSLSHNPEKYTTPIQEIKSIIVTKVDRTTNSDIYFSCKSNFVSIMKPSNDKIVCVKPATAEKLIQRGWIDLN